MTLSNLSRVLSIEERSEATPGLFNRIFSTLSQNIDAINSQVTLELGSGNTLSVRTNIDASGQLHAQGLSIGSTPPSYVATAGITVAVNSAASDYLYLVDSSGARSSYVIGSRAGDTSDGLNIWDASGATMIASFSKQSVRFYQNVVGPVFDVGGALANTLNAATFGTGADSDESRIQAAISQATASGISRVYVPANMYPYSAGSVVFSPNFQMVREGGDWSVYDVRAYGAAGNGVQDDTAALQSAISNAPGGALVYLSTGTYRLTSSITPKQFVNIAGPGVGQPGSAPYGAVLQGAHAASVFSWTPAAPAISAGVLIQDLFLDGMGTANHGFEFNRISGIRFNRVSMRSILGDGFLIGGANDASNVDFFQCYVNNPGNFCWNVQAIYCRLLTCISDGGLISLNAQTPAGSNIYAQGCHFEGASQYGIRVSGVGSLRITNCYTQKVGSQHTGIYLTGSGCGNNLLVGNRINGSGETTYAAIHCDADGSNVLIGNVTAGFARGLVVSENSSAFVGNVISALSEGVWVAGSRNVIAGNHIQVGSAATVAINLVSGSNNIFRSEEHTSELQSQSNLVCRL